MTPRPPFSHRIHRMCTRTPQDKTGSVTWPDLEAALLKCLKEHGTHSEHASAAITDADADGAPLPIVPTAEPAALAPGSAVASSSETAVAPEMPTPKHATPAAVKQATETAKVRAATTTATVPRVRTTISMAATTSTTDVDGHAAIAITRRRRRVL